MPYSIPKSLPDHYSQSSNSHGIFMYLSQSNYILVGVPLIGYLESNSILKTELENLLFISIARLLNKNYDNLYTRLCLNKPLHIRLERVSDGISLYDSSELGLHEFNPSLFIGVTEKSLQSYVETHFDFFTMQQNEVVFDQDGLYRSCLHLGDKPSNFSDWVSQKGSKLWHALYSDYFPFHLGQEFVIQDYSVPF